MSAGPLHFSSRRNPDAVVLSIFSQHVQSSFTLVWLSWVRNLRRMLVAFRADLMRILG